MKRIQLFYIKLHNKAFQKRKLNPRTAFLLFTAIVVVSLFSCTDLDENPESFISEGNYYKTKNDAEAAVNSIYYSLNHSAAQTPYRVLFVTGMDFMSDDVLMSLGATQPDVKVQSTLDHTPATLRVKEIWQQHYVAINRANIAIDKIPLIPYNNATDSAALQRLVLEAKFLRGLYYFNLVRLFGGVPLILHETTSLSKDKLLVERVTADEVYSQIFKDFSDAEGLPWYYKPGDSNAGRASGAAAKAFQALAYLTRANINENNRPANVSIVVGREEFLSKAIEKSNEIIERPDRYYDLFPDYADVFKKSSKNGIEHLFSAQFKSYANGHGNNYATRNAALGIKDKNGVTVVNGTLGDAPTTDLLSKFRSNDKRRAVILTSTYTVNGITYKIDKAQNAGFSEVINKYYDHDVPSNLNESGINVPILKYSEVLLINAEANNELYGPNNEAHTNYNKIRKRAGLPEFTLGNLSQDQFRDSLYLDLRIEDTHEYKRWFDLIREIDKDGNHIMVKTLRAVGKPAASDKHYLYPIPQTEIDVNPKLVQNPGW